MYSVHLFGIAMHVADELFELAYSYNMQGTFHNCIPYVKHEQCIPDVSHALLVAGHNWTVYHAVIAGAT